MFEISRQEFRQVETGLRHFGEALGGTAEAEQLKYKASVECRVHVPDMVPSLREFRVELDEGVAVLGGLAAFLAPLREVATTVHLERELRSWSYCDA